MTSAAAAFELANSLGLLLVEMAWKSTIILGAIFLLAKLLKRRSAALKRTIYPTAGLLMLV